MATVMYRALLRMGSQIDRHTSRAGVKALITATKSTSSKRGRSFESMLCEWNRGEYYLPRRKGEAAPSALAAIITARAELDDDVSQDAGFAAMRHLQLALHLSDKCFLSNTCTPDVVPNNGLQLELAAASVLGKGSILVSHPMSCWSQPLLHRAVVLVVNQMADDRGLGFVQGVVLNKQLEGCTAPTLRQLLTRKEMSVLGGAALLDCRVHCGGDKHSHVLYALLRTDAADDTVGWAVCQDLQLVTRMLQQGELEVGHVRLYAGVCEWQTNRLQSEVERNVWFHCTTENTIDLELETDLSTAMSQLGGEFLELANLPIQNRSLLDTILTR